MNSQLSAYKKDITSQDGEDGMIERIFQVAPPSNRWCLEVGALNGTHHSNSWNLVHEQKWDGLLIEADKTHFKKLAETYEGYANARCMNAFISFEGPTALDALCAAAGMPKDFDLLVLDIDGNDYHVWESMQEFKPRVVCIEFNQTIPNEVEFVQPRDMSVFQGSSLRSVMALAKKKGYELIATTDSNAFFVLASLFPKFDITDNAIGALHSDAQHRTYLFQLYDGTLKIAGQKRMLWHGTAINEEKLQTLPSAKRRYPAHIDASDGLRAFKDKVRRMPGYAFMQKMRNSL
ncbi:MAG: hypothetical protein JWL88_415 [Parcubacteria group bacterium]|nr:hypothetical protein [Parcubacteria group bacterium]